MPTPSALVPRVYSKLKKRELRPAVADFHPLPWSPLTDQTVAPFLSASRSVPTPAPERCRRKATAVIRKVGPTHAEPS